MVSPPEKNGADVMGVAVRTRAASDGNAVEFSSLVGFGDVHGSGISFDYMATRTGKKGTNGWATHGISPPGLLPTRFVYQLINAGFDASYVGELAPDLTHGAFLTFTPLAAGAEDSGPVANLFRVGNLRSTVPGTPELITGCPACLAPLTGSPFDQPAFTGASADFSHVIFESTQNLTTDASGLDASLPKLYEWANGVVTLAGILPDGTPAPNSQAGQGTLVSSSTTAAPAHYAPNAISRDGSRIYFTVRGPAVVSGPLYLRTGNGTPSASTVKINVAEPVPNPSPVDDAHFWTATPDGSKVFFTTTENLVAEDTSNTNLQDLYMYDVNASANNHLTLISAPEPGGIANVKGVVGVSDDGSYVYFVSDEQLLSGGPMAPTVRLFVWHNGVIRDVAALGQSDFSHIGMTDDWVQRPLQSRVSPDGKTIVFRSKNAQSGGADDLPHTGVGDTCPAAGGCEEIYVYNATSGNLTCASCRIPDAPAHVDTTFVPSVGRGVASGTQHLNHPLSADGRYVFFSTEERLVPEDLNGLVSDVYEYDTETNELHLLSSGRVASLGSYFLDASPNGHDVFFAMRDRLVGWDGDNQVDLYDARIDGGLPDPVSAPLECSGDVCHGALVNNPAFAPLSSVGFSGVGNLKPVVKKVMKPLTRAQKLKKALKKCKTKRKKSQRKKCVASARKSFGRTK